MSTIDPIRVHSLVERHLDNLVAEIQKDLNVKTGDAAARYANFERDARDTTAAMNS